MNIGSVEEEGCPKENQEKTVVEMCRMLSTIQGVKKEMWRLWVEVK